MKKTKFRGLRDDQLITILQNHEQMMNAQANVINTQGAVIEGMSKAVSKLIARTGMSVEQFMEAGDTGLVIPS